MFSAEYYREIKEGFEAQMALLDARLRELEEGEALPPTRTLLRERKEEILQVLEHCTEEEREALTFLYGAMPLSDLLDYPADLFLAYARHGVFLWNRGAFAGRVPERLFANYVLHYRVNNEDIVDTRGFFYDKLAEIVNVKRGANAEDSANAKDSANAEDGTGADGDVGAMYAAAVEVNYWCAREATYRSTDGRTQNPRTMYGAAIGRCGEESTMAATALRSVGIPARQIYAPLWAHCDDNHAWVEVWCDGEWFFLGACEPEERLNRGWFVGPASRAVLLQSKWFGKDAPQDRQVGPRGMAKALNHLDRYAHTVPLAVKVVDAEGRPVPGAKVDFQVINHGHFGSIAVVETGAEAGDCGIARLLTGFGDLYVSASAVLSEGGGTRTLYGEALVPLSRTAAGQEAAWEVVLGDAPECREGWRELDFHAPRLGHIHNEVLTPKQQSVGAGRLAQAAEYRQRKAEGFYDAREAERVLGRFRGEDREELEDILRKARGNMGEIVRFLEWDAAGLVPTDWAYGADRWKLQALKTLREKDYWDSRAEMLIDCAVHALPYAGSVPDEIFFRFLFCPRVANEMLRPCRGALRNCLEAGTGDVIRANPACLPEMAARWMVSLPEQEYENLVTSAQGCLRGGVASAHSRAVFCVNLYRALGIPARLNHFDDSLEYYCGGRFVAVAGTEESAELTLCAEGSLKLSDWEHYSIERFEGDGFRRLWLWGRRSREQEGEMTVALRPGIYRAVTVNRAKNGDQLAKVAVFPLADGQRHRIGLSMREIPLESMLTRIPVEDFALRTMEGREQSLSALAGDGKALLLWLEVTREPTEHILNELYDRRADFAALSAPLYVVLKSPEDLENATLRRTMEALPQLRPVLDDFGEAYGNLAKCVEQEPGKLPLAVVLEGGRECVYSDAGYNVGLADILLKILAR